MRRSAYIIYTLAAAVAHAQAPVPAPPPGADKTITPDSGFSGSRDISELSIDELLGNASRLRFNLNFFGDLSATDSTETGAKPGFSLGEPSMLVTADLGESVHSLMEIAYGPNDSFVDVERFQIGWSSGDWSVLAGRIHNPLGYWNGRYHHGHWLMPTISRPRILEFEDSGGLYPVHQVGVFGGWQHAIDDGYFRVDFGIANGRPDDATRVATDSDNNFAKSGVVAAFIQDLFVKGLRIGAGFVYDKIAPAPASFRPAYADMPITELIGNVNVVYQAEELLVIAEGYLLRHSGSGLDAHFLHGYAFAGYRFGRTTPYVREEIFKPGGNPDPFYTPDSMAADAVHLYGFSETILGVRYNLSSWSALKFEYRLEAPLETGHDTIHRFELNWCFGL